MSGDSGEHRTVTVDGVRLRFAAAHMATLGDELEPLHGHNYLVLCRVGGTLTNDHWVIDFSVLKAFVRDACERLDHRFLLQRNSKQIDIEERSDAWIIGFGKREYRFPLTDVIALPIENSTAELIAQWLCETVVQSLAAGKHENLTRIEVTVEEMPGQSGSYQRELTAGWYQS